MSEALVRRGPDDHAQETFRAPGVDVVLAHRRLSIVDLSERGRQPMVDAETGTTIVYNGEIYDFHSLREELRGAGHRFNSDSDTEVLLRAYVEWGEACLTRLRGMYALAIWDPTRRSILLARDPMGIKPLYYAVVEVEGQETILFASEVRALLRSGLVRATLDQEALATYLWNGFVVGPRTLIDGVRLLPGGTSLRVEVKGDESGLAIGPPVPFWSLPPSRPGTRSLRDVHAVLEDSVRMRLVSDVPLGIFLSGGVDSSAIATLAQASSEDRIRTFNICFEEARFDESPYARRVAEELGTDHTEIVLSAATFRAQLRDALGALDQPTFDGINTYFVSRAVREAGLTVALAGTGGDELFGGYRSFREVPRATRAAWIAQWVPAGLRAAVSRSAVRLKQGRTDEIPSQTRWGKLEDLLDTSGELTAAYQVAYGLFTRKMNLLLADGVSSNTSWGLPHEVFRSLDRRAEEHRRRGGPLQAITTLELALFIGERLLRDTDCASMAASLEVRVPLLDIELAATTFGLEAAQRYEPLGRKAVLREVMRGKVDLAIFERPKSGFELPLELWCREALGPDIDETFGDDDLIRRIGLNPQAVQRLWRAFQAGSPGLYWSRVWSLYTLLWWCREYQVEAA